MKGKTLPVIIIVSCFAIIIAEYALTNLGHGRFQNLFLLPTMYSGLLTLIGVWWSISENRRMLDKQKDQSARPFLQILFDLPVGISRICDQVEIGKGETTDSIYIRCATSAPFVWKAYQVNDENQKSLRYEITVTGDVWNEIRVKRDWTEIRLFGTDCNANEYRFLVTKSGIFLDSPSR